MDDDSESSAHPPPLPEVINGRYAVHPRIGSGSYSEVHLGIDKDSGDKVAVKFEWVYAEKTGKLLAEAELYRSLSKKGNVPSIIWCGSEGEYNIMVMELLGPSMEDLIESYGGKFSLKTVLMLAEQMIDRIEYVHSFGIVHRDIKPENFLVGAGDRSNHVYIVDFGLAKRYLDQNACHIPCTQRSSLTGTVRYASLNVHRGFEPSRRDDVGSIGYLLVYMALGRLPWQGVNAKSKKTKRRRIQHRKEQLTYAQLCKDLPYEFAAYLEYCDSLEYDQVPDYNRLRQLMRSAMTRESLEPDLKFDWIIRKVKLKQPMCLNDWGKNKRARDDNGNELSRKRSRNDVGRAVSRDAAQHDGRSFLWNIPADQARLASKGDRLESPDFRLDGVSSRLRLRYYPQGHRKAARGSCSAYVWAEEAFTLQLKVLVNRRSKLIDKDGPVSWKAGKDRGYADFCAAPEGEVAIKVTLIREEVPAASEDSESTGSKCKSADAKRKESDKESDSDGYYTDSDGEQSESEESQSRTEG